MPARDTTHRRDSPLLYAGIFLVFAPVGVLMMAVQAEPLGWLAALVSAALSGAMSVGWAFTFIREKWWLIVPLILFPMFVPSWIFNALTRTDFFDVGMNMTPQWRMIVLAIMCVVFTALGFIISVVHLRRTERRSARAVAELELARRVHTTLAPPIDLKLPFAEIHGRSIASSTMGGDLIDAIAAPDRVDILLGDVSGHGVGAGIVMAMLKACLRSRLAHEARLDAVVADANRVLADLTAPDMFATLVAVRLRPDRTLEFALAGHLPLFHYHAASRRWDRYPNQCLPLGIDHAERFASGSTTVEPGDILAAFTDGLTEVHDNAGRQLGVDGVAAILEKLPHGPLPDMADALIAAVSARGPQLDDRSVILVAIRGPEHGN